jgi:opacity protein-like surface antigen
MSASFKPGGCQMVAVAASIGKPSKLTSGGSIRLTRNGARAAGIAVALMLFGGSGALAQNCTPIVTAPTFVGNVNAIGGVPAATASAIAGALGNVSTAFLSQQTSAFVVGARADQPDQAGGGVWTREVGGHVATKSDTAASTRVVNQPFLEGGVATASTTCASRIEQNFFGVQVGTDVARLNSNGWNVHVGLTTGYLESQGRDVAQSIPPAINPNSGLPDLATVGNISSSFQVPFIGGYVVATSGGFFSDLTVRRELYNVSLNQPAINLNDQQFGARAWSVSAGAGYNFGLQDGWFVEPSAGVIWAQTQVDPFALGGPVPVPVSGTLAIHDIESLIGRATLRFGRTFMSGDMTWTPFGSASVFHEFAPDVTSTFQTCVNCSFIGTSPFNATPATMTVTTNTTRVGTFGQFSAGLAGQLTNSGWVGFVRGDYRIGQNLEGWTANAGLRYNFVVENAVASKMFVKAPRPVAQPYNWTGFYLGGHLGITQGRGHVDFVGTGVSVDPYMSGYLAGGQIGYNVQYGPYVVGVEVDASKTNLNGTRACGNSPGVDGSGASVAFSPLFLTCQNALDWIATAAVRFGTTLPWSDRTLLYVKAGGAATNETITVSCIFGSANLPSVRHCVNSDNVFTNGSNASQTAWGGMVGAGAEFGLTREWSAKAELNYIWFGNRDVTTSDASRLSIGAGIAEAKIGLNYRFGQAY